jgi:hypothetical protein
MTTKIDQGAVCRMARRSAAVTLRRASSSRGPDYAARMASGWNVDDVTQATLTEAWRMARGIGAAWRQGERVALPAGMSDDMAAWLAAWAWDADAVTYGATLARVAPQGGARAAWRTAYGVARRVLRDEVTARRVLAYAARRVGRISPESGSPAPRAALPAAWERVQLGAPTGADADSGAASVAYAYLRRADDGATQAVTEYADADAGNRYASRAEYVRWEVSDADARWTLAVDALADACRSDASLAAACRALLASDGLAGLIGRVLPADAPEVTVGLMSV